MSIAKIIQEKVNIEAVQNHCTLQYTNDVEQISVKFHHRNDGYQRISELEVKFRSDDKVQKLDGVKFKPEETKL